VSLSKYGYLVQSKYGYLDKAQQPKIKILTIKVAKMLIFFGRRILLTSTDLPLLKYFFEKSIYKKK